MNNSNQRAELLLVPCSGIGKVHGLISREAVYHVTDQLMPEQADTVCLALLVTGDPETRQKVQQTPCITWTAARTCPRRTSSYRAGRSPRGFVSTT